MALELRQSRVHAVLGVSHRLRDEAVERLVAGWSGPVKRHVEPDDLPRMVLDMGTASLFEEPALRVIRAGLGYLKRNKDPLLGLIGGEVIGGVVVLVTDHPERKDDALFKALFKAGAVHVAEDPDPKGLVEWLAARLGSLPHGADRPRQVAEALIETLGQNVDGLLGAAEVLAIYRTGQPVDVAGVHDLYITNAAKPPWIFVEAVLDGKAGVAHEQLHATDGVEPFVAVNALAAELRKILACLETSDDVEAARNAGVWGRPNLHYTRRRAQSLGRTAALRLLSGVIHAARQLRQSGTHPELSVEMLVLHARKLVPGGSR